MDTDGKKCVKTNLQGKLVAPIIFGVFAVAILSILAWQLIQYDLYRDLFIYLGLLAAMIWWAFSFALVFLILRSLPRRVASGVAVVVFGILVFPVGILGSIRLGASLEYPKLIAWLIYFLVPFLFSSVLLTIHPFKNRNR
jgi:hypothetical protein